MKYDIKFESENIIFVDLNTNLVNDYLNMVNDSDVSKYISLKKRCFQLEDELEWISEKKKNKTVIFSLLEKNTYEFIGNIELMSIENNIGELGICITPRKQNKHYGYEAIKRFIKYCIDELHLNGISLSVYSHNQKAINLYKKLGFKEYKVDKNVGKYNNNYIDDIYMKL